MNKKREKEGSLASVSTNPWKVAARLFGQLKNQRARLAVVGICVVVYVFLSVYSPYYSAGAVDLLFTRIRVAVESGSSFSLSGELGVKMVTLGVLYLFTAISYYLQGYLMASVAERLILTLRVKIAAKLNKMPLDYYDGNKPGEVLSRVASDLDKVSETLQTGLLKLITAIGTLVGALSFMFYYGATLSLVFLGFVAVSLLVTNVISKKNFALSAERQDRVACLTGLTEEYYVGREVIRAYNRERDSVDKMGEAIDELRGVTRKTDYLQNCVNPTVRMLSRLSQAAVMLIACSKMLGGTMTVGSVQAFFQYMNLAAEPLIEMSYMINSLQSAIASAQRTFEFLDAKEEIPDPSSPVGADGVEGDVVFENIRFGYSPDKILMKDVSFVVKKGWKAAIVGSTGAGKTTLVNLLMRFYEINGGKITIGGVSASDMTRSDLRRYFGMVLQDTWLFDGTIAENIAYGKPDATMDEIKAAAKAAQIDRFIRTLPKGYDTVLDDEANVLSVGQRQLVAIARVFLCNPSAVILDEATSSVDTRSEAEIGKAMKKMLDGRTSFVIAHRLSTIRDADIILFMKNGNIVEQGSHKELLKKKGEYASLYYSQFA